MTDQELDAYPRITPEIASRYLKMYTAHDLRYFLQKGVCPFGFAFRGTGNRMVYRIDGERLKAYKRGDYPMMLIQQ